MQVYFMLLHVILHVHVYQFAIFCFYNPFQTESHKNSLRYILNVSWELFTSLYSMSNKLELSRQILHVVSPNPSWYGMYEGSIHITVEYHFFWKLQSNFLNMLCHDECWPITLIPLHCIYDVLILRRLLQEM